MKSEFVKETASVAVPQALQSLIQNSFGVIDQVMIGQLGTSAIAAVGFASKYISIFTTVLNAAAAGLGIFCAQYAGRSDHTRTASLTRTVAFVSLCACLLVGAASCLLPVMDLYTRDVSSLAGSYLHIGIWGLLWTALTSLLSVVLRCYGFTKEPFYASAAGIFLNTVFNWFFIFVLDQGIAGAAWATVLTQAISALLVLWFCAMKMKWIYVPAAAQKLTGLLKVLLPLVLADFFWSAGENVYVMVYGHTTLDASAAMTMTLPVQSLVIGLLSGFSTAAGIIVGKDLGRNDRTLALSHARSLMKLSAAGSLVLFGLLLAVSPFYVQIYSVSAQVRSLCIGLLTAFGLMSFVKVQNMVLGGGILRAGGHTGVLLGVDLLGTWAAGVPLAFAGLHLFGPNIVAIYLLLNQEEVLRYILCLIIYKKRNWMTCL